MINTIMLCQDGPQQGDPLGALFFCNNVHSLLMSYHWRVTFGDLLLETLRRRCALT